MFGSMYVLTWIAAITALLFVLTQPALRTKAAVLAPAIACVVIVTMAPALYFIVLIIGFAASGA
jgi:hypothetical protein